MNDVEKMQVQDSGPGRVLECLKAKLHENRITNEACRKEIVDIISESHIDINVDPLLQSACQRDLMKLCSHIPVGQGRRECIFKGWELGHCFLCCFGGWGKKQRLILTEVL